MEVVARRITLVSLPTVWPSVWNPKVGLRSCAMSQGTSGDLHWMNYGKPNKGSNVSRYADGLVELTVQALENIRYQDAPPLAMDQKVITLSRRLPDEDRLAWADQLLAKMKGRRPKSRPEVYAEQARFIDENPTEKLVLQTLRIGDLGITTLPNEVYSITGLKLKARSPFPRHLQRRVGQWSGRIHSATRPACPWGLHNLACPYGWARGRC